VARKDFAIETDRKIKRAGTGGDFPRSKIRCYEIVGHSRERFFRSAKKLVDSSKVEARRSLPASPHAFAPRNDRGSHDRVVSALPEVGRPCFFTNPRPNVAKVVVARAQASRVLRQSPSHYALTCTTILRKPVGPDNGLRSGSHSCTSPSPSVARTASL